MTRALFWKEWREQRPIVLAGLAAAIAMPFFALIGTSVFGGSFRVDSLSQVLPALGIIALLPLFACATGAATFADDRADRTLGFLITRPASRRRVWATKVIVAALAFAVIFVGIWGIFVGLGAVIGGERWADQFPQRFSRFGFDTTNFIMNAVWNSFEHIEAGSPSDVLGDVSSEISFVVGTPFTLFLFFAAAVFLSTWTRRALNAALAALVVTLLLQAGSVIVWSSLGSSRLMGPATFDQPIFLGLGFLAASYLRFRNQDLPSS